MNLLDESDLTRGLYDAHFYSITKLLELKNNKLKTINLTSLDSNYYS